MLVAQSAHCNARGNARGTAAAAHELCCGIDTMNSRYFVNSPQALVVGTPSLATQQGSSAPRIITISTNTTPPDSSYAPTCHENKLKRTTALQHNTCWLYMQHLAEYEKKCQGCKKKGSPESSTAAARAALTNLERLIGTRSPMAQARTGHSFGP